MIVNIETDVLRKITVEVKSSLIDYLEYSKDNCLLKVKFKHGKHKGKIRSYEEVSPEQFFNILTAESVGKALIKLLESLPSTGYYS